jgi:hypothetical protein
MDQIQYSGGLVAGQLEVASTVGWGDFVLAAMVEDVAGQPCLEPAEGDLGLHVGSCLCLGGAAGAYNRIGGAAELLGAEGGQDLSRGAR